MSWKPQVQADTTGKWYDNALRFATEEEAANNARDLFQRWTLCTAHRAAPSDEPVNYTYLNGHLIPVEYEVSSLLPNVSAPES